MSTIFNPVAINMQGISLTHEKLHLLCCSVEVVFYDLINVSAFVESLRNHEILVKLNLPLFLVLLREREKSRNTSIIILFVIKL